MAHIPIIINGVAYYPEHEEEPSEGERKSAAELKLPGVTEVVYLPIKRFEALKGDVQKAIDKALEK